MQIIIIAIMGGNWLELYDFIIVCSRNYEEVWMLSPLDEAEMDVKEVIKYINRLELRCVNMEVINEE